MESMKKYRNKEWLKEKYVDERVHGTKIAKMCGVHSTTIYNWLRKFGIGVRPRGAHFSNFVELSDELLEFLDGLLLGDGCIYPHRRSAVYVHTDKHKGYLEWLSSKLGDLGIEESCLHPDSKGRELFRYRSHAYVDLMEVRKRWYPDDTKYTPSDVRITPTVLMNWYIGDGTFYRDDYEILLGVKSEGCREKLPMIKSQLEEMDIYPRINSTGLAIHKSKSLDNFFDYIEEAERPPCYDYKFPL